MRIGLLSSAHMHVESYLQGLRALPNVEVVGLYDDDASRGQAFAKGRQVTWYADIDRLLANVDATVICSENARHRFFVEASADAKLPMLCEKPLATTLDDAVAMLNAAERAHAPLYMALPVRFVPGFAQMLQAVHHGQVGRILAMVATNHGSLPPGWFLDPEQAGGGAVMDHTPHVADLMRLLARSEVDEVFAEMDSRVRQAKIDDSGILTLEFTNGIFATLDPSWTRGEGFPTWGDVTLEVVGTQGVLDFDAFRPHLNLFRSDTPNHRHVAFGDNMDEHLVAAFISSVSGPAPHPLLARGLDGLRALEIALAAYRSGKSHHPERVEHLL